MQKFKFSKPKKFQVQHKLRRSVRPRKFNQLTVPQKSLTRHRESIIARNIRSKRLWEVQYRGVSTDIFFARLKYFTINFCKSLHRRNEKSVLNLVFRISVKYHLHTALCISWHYWIIRALKQNKMPEKFFPIAWKTNYIETQLVEIRKVVLEKYGW